MLGLLLGHVVAVFAQDANIDRAEHVYELFVENQADSIHALLNKNLQEKLSPEVFRDMFKQSESSSGNFSPKANGGKKALRGLRSIIVI